jgi:hypothetical protein
MCITTQDNGHHILTLALNTNTRCSVFESYADILILYFRVHNSSQLQTVFKSRLLKKSERIQNLFVSIN